MNESIEVLQSYTGGGSYPLEIAYTCAHCLTEMEIVESNARLVHHPTHDGVIFKGKPIDCPYAGGLFKRPTLRLELA